MYHYLNRMLSTHPESQKMVAGEIRKVGTQYTRIYVGLLSKKCIARSLRWIDHTSLENDSASVA